MVRGVGRRRRRVLGGRRVPADRRAQARVALTARLLLEYDGSGFAGWATQPGQRTVQEVVEEALAERLGRAGSVDRGGAHRRGCARPGAGGEPPGHSGFCRISERAPAPRRARAGQRARARRLRRPPRRRLAAPIATASTRRATSACSSAAGRCGGATRSTRPLLHECAALLPGTHDFTAFTRTQTQPHATSTARSCGRSGWRSPTACTRSGSRPTPSCAAWCGRWWARCSRSRRAG